MIGCFVTLAFVFIHIPGSIFIFNIFMGHSRKGGNPIHRRRISDHFQRGLPPSEK